MWDIIIDKLNIDDGIDLFNKSDDDIIDIFLGKSWGKLRKKEYAFTCQYVRQLHPSLKAYVKNITKGTKSDHTTFKILIRVV